MRFSTVSATLLVAATQCLAAPKSDAYEVHESRAGEAWIKVAKLESDRVLPVRIGLTQSNLDKGEDLLMEVSDPKSEKYGKYYSEDEIIDVFAPSKETVNAVQGWLESAGFKSDRISQSGNKQWMQVDATVEEVEKLLKTKYHVYEHAESGHRGMGADEYSLPKGIRGHIDFITPAVKLRNLNSKGLPKSSGRFDGTRPIEKNPAQSTASAAPVLNGKCDGRVTPQCIREVYNIPLGDKAAKSNAMGLYESYGEKWDQKDLNNFFKKHSPFVSQGTHPIEKNVDGGVGKAQSPGGSGGETMLDMDIAYPIIHPQNVINYQVDDMYYETHYRPKIGEFNTFLDALDGSYCNSTAFGETGDSPKYDPKYPDSHPKGYHHKEMCGVYKPANVISISYGPIENDQPVNYNRRQCAEWMKLGMRGVSVLNASGDYGVAGNGACLRNGVFAPTGICNCPWVICVGSTTLVKSTGKEIATTQFGSGSGFSNIFPAPKYQSAVVKNYLANEDFNFKSYATTLNKTTGANGGVYNRKGRGFPDIAALGQNIAVIQGGSAYASGGTSASSPLWGAILTRINEERIAAGKSPVGFVNPVLYQNPDALTDVTVGNSPGCRTKGFRAAKGWDPVTGLGTPKYDKLLDVFMSLP